MVLLPLFKHQLLFATPEVFSAVQAAVATCPIDTWRCPGPSVSSFSRFPYKRCTQLPMCLIRRRAILPHTRPGSDVVVHAAGPFQRRRTNPVLEAAIAKRVAYLDVSDDSEFSKLSRKTYGAAAKEARAAAPVVPLMSHSVVSFPSCILLHRRLYLQAGITCITSAGIYPGVSNLMAARIVEKGKLDGLTTDVRFHLYSDLRPTNSHAVRSSPSETRICTPAPPFSAAYYLQLFHRGLWRRRADDPGDQLPPGRGGRRRRQGASISVTDTGDAEPSHVEDFCMALRAR